MIYSFEQSYYNTLKLLVVGDFRDPKTREPYSDDTLISIDNYKDKLGIKK